MVTFCKLNILWSVWLLPVAIWENDSVLWWPKFEWKFSVDCIFSSPNYLLASVNVLDIEWWLRILLSIAHSSWRMCCNHSLTTSSAQTNYIKCCIMDNILFVPMRFVGPSWSGLPTGFQKGHWYISSTFLHERFSPLMDQLGLWSAPIWQDSSECEWWAWWLDLLLVEAQVDRCPLIFSFHPCGGPAQQQPRLTRAWAILGFVVEHRSINMQMIYFSIP